MKSRKRQRGEAAQALTRTVRIYGHEFIINMNGDVYTQLFGHIGHIEDCRDYAELIHDLIYILENDSEI